MLTSLVLSFLLLPLFAILIYGGSLLINFRWAEKSVTSFVQTIFFANLFLILLSFYYLSQIDNLTQIIHLPLWFHISDYHFEMSLNFDRLSAPYCLLAVLLCGVVGKFSTTYLHREPGFHRFFFLLLVFYFGVTLVSLAGTIDLLFVGWEVVGISSVLLISFYHTRFHSINNSFRAMLSYRLCDAGMIAAAAWMHYTFKTADFQNIFYHVIWPNPLGSFAAPSITPIALFLIWASLGKSSMLPMSGWLTRAMEGPTPSSAIFYGALSIHLGPYLLLRCYPFISYSKTAQIVLLIIGIMTALFATIVGRVKADAKTQLAYATMAQVALIMIEIALGFYWVALVHICAHAVLRTLQFLRSMSLIQDFQQNPIIMQGFELKQGSYYEIFIPKAIRNRIYVHAMDELHLDNVIHRFILNPILLAVEWIDKKEDQLLDFFHKKD